MERLVGGILFIEFLSALSRIGVYGTVHHPATKHTFFSREFVVVPRSELLSHHQYIHDHDECRY